MTTLILRSGQLNMTCRAILTAISTVAVLAACGATSTPTAVSPPTAAVSPSAATNQQLAEPSPVTVASANILIRATVTGAKPLLLPSAIPVSWSARVTSVTPSFFSVTYTSPDGAKSLDFAIQVPNPPAVGPNASQSHPNFHGDRRSLAQVDDTTQLTSRRLLIWNEPGTWSEPNGLLGVPYYIVGSGLTDAEFWSFANSVLA